MYTKPTLVRYGSFRELTLLGFGPDGDGGIVILGHSVIDGRQYCGEDGQLCRS